jgi:5-methylcytosine-specific restriction endonuclease McrA
MARPSGPKVRCAGQWTEARFTTFIKNLLRSGSRKWAPNQIALKEARSSRGMYLCAECNEYVPTTVYDEEKKKRVKNVLVDHIIPVIPPDEGFTTWDSFIEGLFVEVDKLQVLCLACHKTKTAEETAIAATRRRQEKDIDNI